MTIMMQGLYDALISVGAAKEIAEKAAVEAADLDSRFAKLERAFYEEAAALRGDFGTRAVKTESDFSSLRGEFSTLAAKTNEGFTRMELAVEKRIQTVEREIAVLKWMNGVTIALVVAILVKAFIGG